jgi:hypothetical protein
VGAFMIFYGIFMQGESKIEPHMFQEKIVYVTPSKHDFPNSTTSLSNNTTTGI